MRPQDLIPAPFRLQLQLLRRNLRYRQQRYRWAQQQGLLQNVQLELSQPIRKSYLFENKLHNLSLASDKVSAIIVQPGEVFSYWRLVGAPTRRNGFRKGRNLINGLLQEDYGGGLCQLSGLLYHLSLLAGLEILERHHHSLDIYKEEERFTPLGADATVVYGYKDLLVQNNQEKPIQFVIQVEDIRLRAELRSEQSISARDIQFERITHATHKEVTTLGEKQQILARSVYRNT